MSSSAHGEGSSSELLATTEAALLAASSADNAERRRAEDFLKPLLRRRGAAAALLELHVASKHAVVRQLAGVLLRPKALAEYNRRSPAGRAAMQAALLRALGNETSAGARAAALALVVALGRALLPAGAWPELGAAMAAASRHSDEATRELAMRLVRELVTSMGGDAAAPLLPGLRDLVGGALADASRRVRGAALRALGTLLVAAPSGRRSRAVFEGALPALLSVGARCLADGDEESALEAVQAVGALIEDSSRLISPHAGPAGELLLAVLADSRLGADSRDAAAEALLSLLQWKPKAFVKRGLVDAALPVIFACIRTYDVEESHAAAAAAAAAGVAGADSGGAAEATVANIGGRVLDGIALGLPVPYVWPRVAAAAAAALREAEPAARYSGLFALCVAAEGCRSAMAPALGTLLPAVLAHAQDSSALVREGVLDALIAFAEFLHPQVLHFHSTLLPAVLGMMAADSNGGAPWIVHKGCQAIENLVDEMEPADLEPYLPALLGALGAELARPGRAAAVREFALAALGSVVAGAGACVRPYFSALFTALLPLTEAGDPVDVRLRGYAIECLGLLAVSAGADTARPALPSLMVAISAALRLEDSTARERAFIAVGCLAEAFHEELGPFVPEIVSLVTAAARADIVTLQREVEDEHAAIAETVDRLAGAEREDGAEGGAGTSATAAAATATPAATSSSMGTDGGGGVGGGDDGDDNDDDDDDDSDGGNVFAHVRTADVEAKKAALVALGHLAKECPRSFAEYLFPSIDLLVGATMEFAPELRAGALLALANAVNGLLAAHPPLVPPRAGEPAALPPDARAALDRIMLTYVATLRRSGDLQTVAAACIALRQACAAGGLASVANCHAPLMRALLLIGCGRARCQRTDDDDGGDDGGGGGGGGGEDDDATATASISDDDEVDPGAADPAARSSGPSAVAAAAARAGLIADGCASAARLSPVGDADMLDSELFDEATDAVAAVAAALGEHFAPRYLAATARAWLARAAPARPEDERRVAVGLWGELAKSQGAALAAYFPEVLPVLLAGARDANDELRRNSLFGLGALAEFVPPEAAAAAAPAMLAAIAPSLASPRAPDADYNAQCATDNAVAALCKIISAAPQAVPIARALPPLLALLPLAADHVEGRPVYTALLRIAAADTPEARASLPRLLALAAHALLPGSRVPADVLADIVRPGLRAAMHSQRAAAPDALAAALATLDANQRAAIDAAMTTL